MLIIIKPSTKKNHKKMCMWLYKECEKRQIQLDMFITTGNFAADCAAIAKLAKQHTRVVAVGGDGTLHLTVNGLINSECSLALLPQGTGNDFARGFACNISDWQNSIFSLNDEPIDIGQINDRYFINVAGVGFDAHVVKSLQGKPAMSSFGYSFAGFKHLLSYKPHRLVGNFAGQSVSQINLITVFANHRFFGGGLAIAPKAQLNNGLLECYAMSAGGMLANLYHFLRLLLRNHHGMKGLIYQQVNSAVITSAGLLIEADGELVGETPAIITVHPQALRFCTPFKSNKKAPNK